MDSYLKVNNEIITGDILFPKRFDYVLSPPESKIFFIDYYFKGPFTFEYKIYDINDKLIPNQYFQFRKKNEKLIFKETDKEDVNQKVGYTYVFAKLEIFENTKTNYNFIGVELVLNYVVSKSSFIFYYNTEVHICENEESSFYFQNGPYQRSIQDSEYFSKKNMKIPSNCNCYAVQLKTIDQTSISLQFQTNQYYNFEKFEILNTPFSFNNWFHEEINFKNPTCLKLFRDSLTKGTLFYDGDFIRIVAEGILSNGWKPIYKNPIYSKVLEKFIQLATQLNSNCVVVNNLKEDGFEVLPQPINEINSLAA